MAQLDSTEFKALTDSLYADNTTGNISAADLRAQMDNLADSATFKTTNQVVTPNADDDDSDTGGRGAFTAGDIWIDVATNNAYICLDATTGAAIWEQISEFTGSEIKALYESQSDTNAFTDNEKQKLANTETSIESLIADTTFTYTSGQDRTVAAGDIVEVQEENISLRVVASAASAYDYITANGVKFKTLLHPVLSPRRNLRSIIDSVEPMNNIRNEVVIEKIRIDPFIEFAVYSPLDSTGIDWARWFFATRFFPGASGAPDVGFVTLAKLYSSTVIPVFGENRSTGITAATPTITYATGDATSRDASFIAAGTVNGVTDITYTTTVGDSVTYTVVVPAGGRIYMRTNANFANGGIADINIQDSGAVEITSDEYLARDISGQYIADTTKSMAPGAGLTYIPLAEVVDADTYTVTLTLDASSQVDGRLYDGGIEVYNAVGFDEVGVHGTVFDSTSGGTLSDFANHPGTVLVYEVTNATRIRFDYFGTTVAGIANFEVYDNTGTEISTYVNQTIDMSSTNGDSNVLVAEDLPLGTYYLHVILDNATNSTDARLYAYGLTSYNQNVPGTVGTDEFDILDMPANPSSANAVGTNVLAGPGNWIYASEFRPSSSSPGDEDFVSGVHLNETALDNTGLTIRVDNQTVDWATANAGDTFAGSSIEIDFTTTLSFPLDSVDFATLQRILTFRRGASMLVETVKTQSEDAFAHNLYINMLQCPNGGDTRSDSVGGGYENWAVERGVNYSLNTSSNIGIELDEWAEGFATWNNQYAVYSSILNAAEINEQYAEFLDGENNGLLRDNTSHQAKAYVRATGRASRLSEGILLPSGHVERVVKCYRIVPSTDAGFLLAG